MTLRNPILLATVVAALTLAVATTPAAAIETIDCQRDHNLAERTICASQRLQILDAKVTESYADIMLDSHVKSRIKQAVHESQRDFLRRRDACGRDVVCLTGLMERRVTHIKFYR